MKKFTVISIIILFVSLVFGRQVYAEQPTLAKETPISVFLFRKIMPGILPGETQEKDQYGSKEERSHSQVLPKTGSTGNNDYWYTGSLVIGTVWLIYVIRRRKKRCLQ
ncbi:MULTISPECIES: LPXTG cell wall anchor domain-containing protein [unclassified Enterococcus]|uniref:LPXTG cell wall anchor domain-containing protein n=1 Tax=unclassified Enterococcus TaxID=2608891 RepID=UPI0013EE2F8B|nr:MULTISPECIES: LPXTG cell wall anchor domain-containing protein [unclassified Enterococcus]